MSTTSAPRPVVANHGDAIRIVPLHVPAVTPPSSAVFSAAATSAPPQLTYRGGPLMTAVEVFTVFWGSAWQHTPNDALLTQINQFFDFVLTSPLLDQLSEYSVAGQTIGHGVHDGTITITTPLLHHSVTDTAIQHMLQGLIAAGSVPPASANRLYFIYLPPGVKVIQGGSASCQAFCGYHNDIAGQVFYAAIPFFPGCSGCTGGLAPFDALTSTSSHELCEATTDPIPGQGWYDDSNGEIGDICAWKTKMLGAYTVQLEWSNSANQCV